MQPRWRRAAGDAVAGRLGHRAPAAPPQTALAWKAQVKMSMNTPRDQVGIHGDERQADDDVGMAMRATKLLPLTAAMRFTPPMKMTLRRWPRTRPYWRPLKAPWKSVADGVGLNHVAHEAQGQDDGDREGRQEPGEDAASLRGECRPVRPPPGGLVLILVELRQTGLGSSLAMPKNAAPTSEDRRGRP